MPIPTAPATTLKVFFEPGIPAHAPELYAFDRTDSGITAGDAEDAAAIERYHSLGFLMVKGLLASGELDAARAELEAMALADEPDCAELWYEGSLRERLALDPARDRAIDGTVAAGFAAGQAATHVPALPAALRAAHVRKFMGFVDRRPALTALARHSRIEALLRRILGAAPRLFQDMALVKPARGREKPWHQDHAYFNLALDTPICGVWIPMGVVTPENGCMHMLAGAHKGGPRPHVKRRDWQICDTDIEPGDRVAVPMGPGDVLLFDGKIPHGTPINRTSDFRWAVQFHYRPPAAIEIADEARMAVFGSEGRDVTC